MFADPHSKVRQKHVSHALLLKVKADVRKQQFTLSVERAGTVRAGGGKLGSLLWLWSWDVNVEADFTALVSSLTAGQTNSVCFLVACLLAAADSNKHQRVSVCSHSHDNCLLSYFTACVLVSDQHVQTNTQTSPPHHHPWLCDRSSACSWRLWWTSSCCTGTTCWTGSSSCSHSCWRRWAPTCWAPSRPKSRRLWMSRG